MAGIDKNTLFCLTGEGFFDASNNNIQITNTKLTEANIVDEEIQGHPIKCIDLNTAGGYLSFTMDDSFLGNAYTIEWWEKDADYVGLSGLFTNMTTSSGNYFGIGRYQSGTNTFVNMAQSGTYFMNSQAIGNDKKNEWVHRAIVFDGTDKYNFFENGVLFKTITNAKKAINGKHSWAIGKWRNTTIQCNRKIYNFMISSIQRHNEDGFTPQIEKYEKPKITPDKLQTGAKQKDVINGLVKITNVLSKNIMKEEVSFADKIETFEYTNSDGMPETYNWVDLNGFKVMWINVKMSDYEYTLGASGLLMKTINIPQEAQIFNNLIMANITSFCRESNNTISRLVQNAEIISNTSVRARWRHTDNINVAVDRFTLMLVGF